MAAVIAGALRALFIAGTLIFGIAQNRSEDPRTVLSNIYFKSDTYAKDRFGTWWERWALRLMLIDMDLLKQVSDIINDWNDMELLKWNENLLGSFNGIAVAGSVLASVNITALSLDSVSDLHWTARAAFSVSLLSSVLSVVFCIRTQRQLYLIGGPTELKRWLSNGQLRKPIRSSISAIRVLQLPVELLTVSWITFIAGLILYTSLMWRLHSNPGGVDYRNILICILLVLFILVGYYELMGAIKDVEQGKAHDPTAPSKPEVEPPEDGISASIAEHPGLPDFPELQEQLRRLHDYYRQWYAELLRDLQELQDRLRALHKQYHQWHSELLLNKSAYVNVPEGRYGNALQAASVGGHERIVMLLLDRNVDVNAQGGYYGNALQAASAGGHEQIVKLLIDKGANVNAKGGYYGNALQAASAGGHELIVELLVYNGADINAQGGEYGNALHAASAGGYEHVVKMLLEQGAEVNAHGSSESKLSMM